MIFCAFQYKIIGNIISCMTVSLLFLQYKKYTIPVESVFVLQDLDMFLTSLDHTTVSMFSMYHNRDGHLFRSGHSHTNLNNLQQKIQASSEYFTFLKVLSCLVSEDTFSWPWKVNWVWGWAVESLLGKLVQVVLHLRKLRALNWPVAPTGHQDILEAKSK